MTSEKKLGWKLLCLPVFDELFVVSLAKRRLVARWSQCALGLLHDAWAHFSAIYEEWVRHVHNKKPLKGCEVALKRCAVFTDECIFDFLIARCKHQGYWRNHKTKRTWAMLKLLRVTLLHIPYHCWRAEPRSAGQMKSRRPHLLGAVVGRTTFRR